ncbi:nucleotidyltransferase domain-containing protein [bacterium]|nr:nucleotidyltransferase domain-containing protein [bacterium]
MTTRENIIAPLHEHYKYLKECCKVIYTGLYGSQNYDLYNENSDIDSKTIIIPSVRDIALGVKPHSSVVKFDDGAQSDVKDVRLMIKNFLKQNVNFLEILFTDYFFYNHEYSGFVDFLRSNAERIAHYNPMLCVKCMCGMAKDKMAHMEHSSPATEDRIAQFGYDPKELHHIVRLRELAENYTKGMPFGECLKSNHKPYLMKIKNGDFELAAARQIAKTEIEVLERIKQNFTAPIDDGLIDLIEKELINLFCQAFREV